MGGEAEAQGSGSLILLRPPYIGEPLNCTFCPFTPFTSEEPARRAAPGGGPVVAPPLPTGVCPAGAKGAARSSLGVAIDDRVGCVVGPNVRGLELLIKPVNAQVRLPDP